MRGIDEQYVTGTKRRKQRAFNEFHPFPYHRNWKVFEPGLLERFDTSKNAFTTGVVALISIHCSKGNERGKTASDFDQPLRF